MIVRSALTVLLSSAACCALQAQITVNPMVPVAICGSPTLNVSFTANGTYNAGNVFSVELSDASGSFAAPSVIGSVVGTASGSISCTFPAGLTGGTGRAIRVVASDPGEIGDPYTLPLTTVVPSNAGNSATLTVCENAAPFSMLAVLGGTPDAGGMWTSPNGNPCPNLFTPTVDPTGCYTYVAPGIAPCANDAAMLCIMIAAAPDAGTDASLNWCQSAGPIDLLAQLNGTPEPGGVWTDDDATGQLIGGIVNASALAPGTYDFSYTISAPGCAAATAQVTVTIINCAVGPSVPNYPVE